ncbi:MAG: alpha/beta fold hydrolase [Pseudohongiellaceae bacterium]
MSLLPAIEIEAPRHTPVNAAIIWLHGLGADGSDFAAIVPQLELAESYGIRFVFPHAPSIPVSINNGYVMPAWYDIFSLELDRRDFSDEQLIESAQQIQLLIDREIERGIDSRRIIVAGFSQGGAVAYHAALSYAEPLGGIMALSTWFATANRFVINPANQKIPILICHGSQDPVVPEILGQRSQAALQSLGMNPVYRSYPMEHNVSQREIEDISTWIRQQLGTDAGTPTT